MLTLILLTVLAGTPQTDLLGLVGCSACAELPPDWRMRPVSGVPAPEFSVRSDGGEPVLRVDGTAAAAWAYNRLESPLAAGSGRLSWSWRTLESPRGADLSREASDDAPLRVYVVFGRPTLLGNARAIFYSWGGSEPLGYARPSFASPEAAVVGVAGAPEADGRWRTETVRPFEDYRRFWTGEPPPIHVVGVMQDTDSTGGSASAELRSLVWRPAS